jgi:hypothetical protein
MNFAATNTETRPNVNLPTGELDPKKDLLKLAEPLGRLLGPADQQYAPFYAQQMMDLGTTFKDAAIKKVTEDMDKWAAANPDKGIEAFHAEFKAKLSTAVMVQKTFKDYIGKMAQQAIDRMKDTFEG